MADKNKADLVTTRIVPWDDNKDIRLNHHNGICLTKMFSDAFVQRCFTFSDRDYVLVSDNPEVNKTLSKYKNIYE
ncbi:hypothetical protein [Companilactobacillus muriivasis]|uniref:hypothetical protein n=1 Tax=Companilactobacillus muriivasis TaxID=3081444 RepID=UPI0030C692D0